LLIEQGLLLALCLGGFVTRHIALSPQSLNLFGLSDTILIILYALFVLLIIRVWVSHND
jgi:hypothetical protein